MLISSIVSVLRHRLPEQVWPKKSCFRWMRWWPSTIILTNDINFYDFSFPSSTNRRRKSSWCCKVWKSDLRKPREWGDYRYDDDYDYTGDDDDDYYDYTGDDNVHNLVWQLLGEPQKPQWQSLLMLRSWHSILQIIKCFCTGEKCNSESELPTGCDPKVFIAIE